MAEILEDAPGIHRGGARPKYPWDEWLDGKTWLIKRGEDYAVPSTSMTAMIRMTARRKGGWVTTIANYGDSIVFRVKRDAEA